MPLKTKKAEILLVQFPDLRLGGPHHCDFVQAADALRAPALSPDQLELIEIGNLGMVFVILGDLAFLVEWKAVQGRRGELDIRRACIARGVFGGSRPTVHSSTLNVCSRAASDDYRRSATSTTTAMAMSPAAHPANNP